MAQLEKEGLSPVQERIFDRLEPRADGTLDHPWPNGSHLIPADREWAGRELVRAAEAGEPAVLFFPDGREVLLTPTSLS